MSDSMGPWKATRYTKHIYGPIPISYWVVEDENGDEVVIVGSGPLAQRVARLIAAAPELLAVLEGCIVGYEEAIESLESEFSTALWERRAEIDRAREAIKKARGE